jgi:formiminoglutamase
MTAIDMTVWQGRVDSADGALGQRWHQRIRAHDESAAAGGVALLGFACDAGVARNHGRVGASDGPAAVRRALSNLPIHAHQAIFDAGDVVCDGDDLEAAQQDYAQRIHELLSQKLLPIGLGGGHEIAFGSFSGLAAHLSHMVEPKIGVINFDAHFDLRADARASSGTPFRQISEDCARRGCDFRYCCLGVSEFANTQALFERAQDLNVIWRTDEQMTLCELDETKSVLKDFISSVDVLYFTLCLDVLPASIVPGVSAPAARGVSLEVIEPLVDMICASGKLALFDIAELNPSLDIDQRSARVAARLVARVAKSVVESK